MTSLTILDLPIAEIDVPSDRARDFSSEGAEFLAAIIAEQGLFHPIRVRRVGERYQLISGLHRLNAFALNQQVTIPAVVVDAINDDAARLEEVMENPGRAELIALDHCHHLFELKQVWERMYPEAKNGGNFGNQYTKGKKALISARRPKCPTPKINSEDMPIVFGFARAFADKIGLDQRSIRRAVMIWTRLDPEVRRRLVGTDLATKQTELLLLSEQKAPVQVKVLDLILGNRTRAMSVSDALNQLGCGVPVTHEERKFLSVSKVFIALGEPMLDRLIAVHEDRIIKSLKRQGRL